jgi:glutamine synthetase
MGGRHRGVRRVEEIRRIFPPGLIDNMLATKRQELRYMADLSDTERRDLYLDTV